ncbi:hypothetical protein B0H17DRAFT_1134406 [Mycena rosella]|uniref:Uncharacterized protein n=1 Tax=Mycena rosella TaxID=1033263 RepID=A0AAD7DFU7_MYCRO|nr:hypothetical protein B0H17DRAFT_1134406 [Mycena rosella]
MSPSPPRMDTYTFLNDGGDGSPLRLLPYGDYDVLPPCPFAAPIIPPDADELSEEIHSLFFYNHWAFSALLPLIRCPDRFDRIGNPEYVAWLFDMADTWGKYRHRIPQSVLADDVMAAMIHLMSKLPGSICQSKSPLFPESEVSRWDRWTACLPRDVYMSDRTNFIIPNNFCLPFFLTDLAAKPAAFLMPKADWLLFKTMSHKTITDLQPFFVFRHDLNQFCNARLPEIAKFLDVHYHDLFDFKPKLVACNPIPELIKRFACRLRFLVEDLTEAKLEEGPSGPYSELVFKGSLPGQVMFLPSSFNFPVDWFDSPPGPFAKRLVHAQMEFTSPATGAPSNLEFTPKPSREGSPAGSRAGTPAPPPGSFFVPPGGKPAPVAPPGPIIKVKISLASPSGSGPRKPKQHYRKGSSESSMSSIRAGTSSEHEGIGQTAEILAQQKPLPPRPEKFLG